MKTKDRLSASIDAELLAQVEAAAGRGATVSAWVNEAIRLKLEHDRRLAALAAFVRSFEDEHGPIGETEMTLARRRLRARGGKRAAPRARKAG